MINAPLSLIRSSATFATSSAVSGLPAGHRFLYIVDFSQCSLLCSQIQAFHLPLRLSPLRSLLLEMWDVLLHQAVMTRLEIWLEPQEIEKRLVDAGVKILLPP